MILKYHQKKIKKGQKRKYFGKYRKCIEIIRISLFAKRKTLKSK